MRHETESNIAFSECTGDNINKVYSALSLTTHQAEAGYLWLQRL